MAARYQLRKAANGQHYFNLTAENNKIVLTSEMYDSMAAAQEGIEAVRVSGPEPERYDRRRSVDGQDYFVLQAANGEIVGQSEMYRSSASLENGTPPPLRAGGR